MNSSVAALFLSNSVILTIVILHVFGSPRAAWARIILQSTDTEFRYDFKSSQMFRLRRKKEKRNIFQELEKKKETSFRRTTNYIYSHSHISFFFLIFRFAKFMQEDIHATQFSSWKTTSGNPSLPTRYNIPLFYTHVLHIRLAFSRVLALSPSYFSLILVPSTKSICLFTFLLYILPPVF